MLKASIIIPNLHSPVIDKTLQALREQTYGLANVEIIIVGLDKYGLVQNDGVTRFVQTPHPLCAAAARNVGIDSAQGQILIFLDADCVPVPDWLERLIKVYADNDDISVVAGGVAFPTAEYWTLADNIANFYSYLVNAPPGERNFLLSLNFSVRRAVIERVGRFDESFPGAAGEDTDLTIRMRLAGYRLWFEPEAAVYHCPVRNSLRQFVKRSFIFGQTMMKVYWRYKDEIQLPYFRRHPLLLLLLAPILGTAVTAKIFLENKNLLKYWYTIPAVFINKVLWRVGGAYQLWNKERAKI